MSTTITATVCFVTTSCSSCGVLFAIPEWLERKRRSDGEHFYCPNGHPLWFGKSRADKLQEELDQKARELRTATCEILNERNAREEAERKLRRVNRGVCPHCRRSFQNLARHMACKHKEK